MPFRDNSVKYMIETKKSMPPKTLRCRWFGCKPSKTDVVNRVYILNLTSGPVVFAFDIVCSRCGNSYVQKMEDGFEIISNIKGIPQFKHCIGEWIGYNRYVKFRKNLTFTNYADFKRFIQENKLETEKKWWKSYSWVYVCIIGTKDLVTEKEEIVFCLNTFQSYRSE